MKNFVKLIPVALGLLTLASCSNDDLFVRRVDAVDFNLISMPGEEMLVKGIKNKQIEIYKAYAEKIYSEILKVYKESEKETRDKLQNTINDIFKQIYEGGLSLTIDDKYHVSVYSTDIDDDDSVEASTAQSISVIFAFTFSSLIKTPIFSIISLSQIFLPNFFINCIGSLQIQIHAPVKLVQKSFRQNFVVRIPRVRKI